MDIFDLSALANFTAVDFETANGSSTSICQVGLVRVEQGKIVEEFECLVQPPNNDYHWGNVRVHGINRHQTIMSPNFKDVWPQIQHFFDNGHFVAHNVKFDAKCLIETLKFYQLAVPKFKQHCTVQIFKRNLAVLCQAYNIPLQHHNALSDARACAHLFLKYLKEGKPIEIVK